LLAAGKEIFSHLVDCGSKIEQFCSRRSVGIS
jgi:hypothetical protein